MSIPGRPLRFLSTVILCWIGARAIMLTPLVPSIALPEAAGDAVASAPPLAERSQPPLAASVAARSSAAMTPVWLAPLAPSAQAARAIGLTVSRPPIGSSSDPVPTELNLVAATEIRPGQPSLPPLVTPVARVRRWSSSTWLALRGGDAAAAPSFARLGASQTGLRVTRAVGERLALAARIASPIQSSGREAALGVEWRPLVVPIRLVAEQRFALDQAARGGPSLGLIGGVDAVPLVAGTKLEGYGQAGVIWRGRAESYAEGSARVTRTIADIGPASIDIGGGVWGGIQPGAARLDAGPGVRASLPLAGRTLRLAVDWRQRIAGDARPGSGLALTFASDF